MKQYLRFKKWVEQEKVQSRLNNLLFVLLLLIPISLIVGIFNKNISGVLGLSTEKDIPSIILPTQMPTSDPTPTFIPTPTPKIYVPIPTIDPDPIVTCDYQHLGPQKIRSSLCSTQLECEVNGKWYFYPSLDACKQAQSNYWKNYNSGGNYAPPATAQNIPTSEPSVSCVLSYGTYRFLQSDCDNAKQRDKEDQERKQEQNVQDAIRSLERQYDQYQEEEQRKANLSSCLAKAKEDMERFASISDLGELALQQLARNYGQAENQCHTIYGY